MLFPGEREGSMPGWERTGEIRRESWTLIIDDDDVLCSTVTEYERDTPVQFTAWYCDRTTSHVWTDNCIVKSAACVIMEALYTWVAFPTPDEGIQVIISALRPERARI